MRLEARITLSIDPEAVRRYVAEAVARDRGVTIAADRVYFVIYERDGDLVLERAEIELSLAEAASLAADTLKPAAGPIPLRPREPAGR